MALETDLKDSEDHWIRPKDVKAGISPSFKKEKIRFVSVVLLLLVLR